MKKLLLTLLCLMIVFSTSAIAAPNESWPTKGWTASTPEEQGMDSGKLGALLEYVSRQNVTLNSIFIVRHGRVVLETYFAPYRREIIQDICSCTKSFTSTAVGAAIGEGLIKDVDQKVLSFFPERTIAEKDAMKENMALRHLLTMSSGLNWPEWGVPYTSGKNAENQMVQSRDWVRFILDRPMAESPGTRFNYNSGASHLLSAVVQKSTGRQTSDYLNEKIFKLIGIQNYYWGVEPGGVVIGGGALQLAPESMAKFGYLYLKNGRWEDRQLLPEVWVREATQNHIGIGRDGGFGYGYQWWVDPWGYSARGWGGQYIIVIPEKDMVVVFTSHLSGYNIFSPEQLLTYFILPAAKSDQALPANPRAVAKLKVLAEALQNPKPKQPSAVTSVGKKISGKTYEFPANSGGWRSVTFRFNKADECQVTLETADGKLPLSVGLDDTYRHTRLPNIGEFALKGEWINDDTFEFDAHYLPWPDVYTYKLKFTGEKVTVDVKGFVEGNTDSFEGKEKR